MIVQLKRLLVVSFVVISPAVLWAGLRDRTPAQQRPDVSGTWRVFLPAGFEHEAALRHVEGNKFRFEPGHLTFSGVYEIRGNRLVLAEPADPAHKGFEWEIRSPYLLTMSKQASTTGADYMGAILFRGQAEARAAKRTIVE